VSRARRHQAAPSLLVCGGPLRRTRSAIAGKPTAPGA
jgi:hypothetical protein